MTMRLNTIMFPLFGLFLLLFASGCMTPGACAPSCDMGFWADRDRSLNGSERLRILGPLFERQESAEGMEFDAVRPFYNRLNTPDKAKSVTEILWPIGMIKSLDDETFWRFFPAYGRDYDNTKDDSRYKFVVFPIYIQGRDVHGENYLGFFPVGGKVHEFFGQDKITFVLFPLYAHSVMNDVETTDVLWPILSWADGGNVSRFRVFPFYGRSVNIGRWEKQFVMWPIWTSAKYTYPNEKGSGFILFPLCGHAKLGDKETWMLLPPFFRYSRGVKHREINCPYPFIQYASGEYEKFYLWPVMGHKEIQGEKSWFFVWPIVTGRKLDRNENMFYQFQVVPFLISDISRRKTDGSVDKRYFKLWPLMSYRRDDDASRLRMLDLWPLRDRSSIDKNFAPFWTLYSRSSVDDNHETEFLWGLYRNRQNESSRKWSVFPLFSWSSSDGDAGSLEWKFLMGLFGYKRDDLQKSYRLLYFRKTGRNGESEIKELSEGMEAGE